MSEQAHEPLLPFGMTIENPRTNFMIPKTGDTEPDFSVEASFGTITVEEDFFPELNYDLWLSCHEQDEEIEIGLITRPLTAFSGLDFIHDENGDVIEEKNLILESALRTKEQADNLAVSADKAMKKAKRSAIKCGTAIVGAAGASIGLVFIETDETYTYGIVCFVAGVLSAAKLESNLREHNSQKSKHEKFYSKSQRLSGFISALRRRELIPVSSTAE